MAESQMQDLSESEVLERFSRIVAKSLRVDPSKVTPDASLTTDLGAESLDLEGTKRDGPCPIEPATFYDRDARTHKARREKQRHAIHHARAHEGAMDAAATLDQQGLHLALGQGPQQGWKRDAAVAVGRQERHLCAGGFELAPARLQTAIGAARLDRHDERRRKVARSVQERGGWRRAQSAVEDDPQWRAGRALGPVVKAHGQAWIVG